jgi:hypothetical protein
MMCAGSVLCCAVLWLQACSFEFIFVYGLFHVLVLFRVILRLSVEERPLTTFL